MYIEGTVRIPSWRKEPLQEYLGLRTWWIIGLVLSITACTFFVHKTWTKWKNNPVIISFAKEHTSVWEIPFPAVTICPLVKVKPDKFNYTAFYLHYLNDNFLDDELNTTENHRKFWDLAIICESYPYHIDRHKYRLTEETTSIIKNIKMVSPTLRNTTGKHVIWKNHFNKSYEIFAEQITAEGLCFSSNTLSHTNMYTEQMAGIRIVEHYDESKIDTKWSIENGYSSMDKGTAYPLRTAQAGIEYGLDVTLWDRTYERTEHCGDMVAGFKMILHNPAEIPRISENYFLIPSNQRMLIAVTPKAIKTSKNLLDISSNTRNCYFEQERKLQFFKIYTQYNCEIECLANITLELCGCVPFYLPRQNYTKTCVYENIECIINAKDKQFKYFNILRNKNTVINEHEKQEFEIFRECRCLTSCDYLDYEVEISQAENLEAKYSTEFKTKQLSLSPISIYYKDSQFLALERNELYGQTEFIANIGGLLGLFMGFSFLSFLEIIFFLSLRVWCMMYRKNKTNVVPTRAKIVWINEQTNKSIFSS